MARKRVKGAYGKRRTKPVQAEFKKTAKKVEKAIKAINKSMHKGKVPQVKEMRKYFMQPTKDEALAKQRIKQMNKFLKQKTLKDLDETRERFENFLTNYAGVDIESIPGYDYYKFVDFFSDIQSKLGIKYQESELINDLWTAKEQNVNIFEVMEHLQARDEDFSTMYEDFKPSARRKKAYDWSAFKRNTAYHKARK